MKGLIVGSISSKELKDLSKKINSKDNKGFVLLDGGFLFEIISTASIGDNLLISSSLSPGLDASEIPTTGLARVLLDALTVGNDLAKDLFQVTIHYSFDNHALGEFLNVSATDTIKMDFNIDFQHFEFLQKEEIINTTNSQDNNSNIIVY